MLQSPGFPHAHLCYFCYGHRWLDRLGRLRTALLPQQVRSAMPQVVYLGTLAALRPENRAKLTQLVLNEAEALMEAKPGAHRTSCLWALFDAIVHSSAAEGCQELQQVLGQLEHAAMIASAKSKFSDYIMKVCMPSPI